MELERRRRDGDDQLKYHVTYFYVYVGRSSGSAIRILSYGLRLVGIIITVQWRRGDWLVTLSILALYHDRWLHPFTVSKHDKTSSLHRGH